MIANLPFNVNVKLIRGNVWSESSKNKSIEKLTFWNSCSLNFFPNAFPRKGFWLLFLTSPKSWNNNFLLIWIQEQIWFSSAGKKETAFGKKLAVIFAREQFCHFWREQERVREEEGHGRWSHGVKRLILAVNLMRRLKGKWDVFDFLKWKKKKEDDLMGWSVRWTGSLHVSPTIFLLKKVQLDLIFLFSFQYCVR